MNEYKILLSDFNKICRTCLAQGEMKSLYEECRTEECLIDKLMSCTFIQFSKNDGLPEQICMECIKELNLSYTFAKKCEKSDTLLRKCLSESCEKPKRKSDKNECVNKTEKQNENDVKQNERDEILIQINIDKENLYENRETYTGIDEKDGGYSESFVNINSCNINSIGNTNTTTDNIYNISETKNGEAQNHFGTEQRNFTNIELENSSSESEASVFQDAFHNQAGSKRRRRVPLKRDKICHICSKAFPKYELKIHMRSHTKEKPYMCQMCGQQFSIKCNLQRHLLTHTGVKPHRCALCGRAFTQQGSLTDHMRTHTNEKPFMCSVCGKSFRQSVQLRVHKRAHDCENGEKPLHKCNICQRTFLLKSVLKTHLLIHGEKKFECQDCGKLFAYKSGLQSHSRVHSGVKPYCCSICGKANAHLAGLKTHMLVHTKEKRFICDVCSKAFAQRNHLKCHLQTHTGAKPYHCTICGKNFSSNGTLTVHTRIHSGIKPFSCDLCKKPFYDSSSMRKHRKTHTETSAT